MLSWHMGLELGSLKTIILLWESAKKKSLLPSCQDFSLLNYFCLSQNESSITNTYIDRFWIRAKLSKNIFLRQHLAFIFGYLFPKLKHFHYLCLGGGFFLLSLGFLSKMVFLVKILLSWKPLSILSLYFFVLTIFKLFLKATLGHINEKKKEVFRYVK